VNEKTNRDEGHRQPEQSWRRLKKPIHEAENAPPLLSPSEGNINTGLSLKGLIVIGVRHRPTIKYGVPPSLKLQHYVTLQSQTASTIGVASMIRLIVSTEHPVCLSSSATKRQAAR
jgi:hypothetical protein